MDKDFLLTAYSQGYGPEAGEWNLSLENKYLEYMFAKFFEENFVIQDSAAILNIGIGAGCWDRYLSFKVPKGCLYSIDIDEVCCRQLREGLVCEKNPNKVTVICDNFLEHVFDRKFDIVTMVGTTAAESKDAYGMMERSLSLLDIGSSIFLQAIKAGYDYSQLEEISKEYGCKITSVLIDDTYDIHAEYYKIEKQR